MVYTIADLSGDAPHTCAGLVLQHSTKEDRGNAGQRPGIEGMWGWRGAALCFVRTLCLGAGLFAGRGNFLHVRAAARFLYLAARAALMHARVPEGRRLPK